MSVDDLISNPSASSLTWYLDSDTSEVVAECNWCGAELRISRNEPPEKVTFEHEAECSWMREREAKTRARELTRKLADILGEEPDSEPAVSAQVVLVGERHDTA